MRLITFFDELNQSETEYFMPGEWDELTPDQLLFLIDLVNRNISAEKIKLKMFLYCIKGRIRRINIDLSYHVIIGKKKHFDLSADELHALSEIFDFLFIYDPEPRINPLLLNNPFPVIRAGWVKLYGPADGLTDFTYQRFMELQVAHSESGNNIDRFLSFLYRRKNGKQSKWFRLIPEKKKIAILWFYLGCMNFFGEKFPLVFSGESASDVIDGQMRIVDALAKNDVTKKEKVRKSDLYEALYTMQIAAEESERLKNKD